MLHLVDGKRENLDEIVKTIEQFFENLNIELEDWKVSMEEFREGTRVFVQFQVIVKKR